MIVHVVLEVWGLSFLHSMGVDTTCTQNDGQMAVGGVTRVHVDVEQTLRTRRSPKLMTSVSRSLPTLNIPFNTLQHLRLSGKTSFGH